MDESRVRLIVLDEMKKAKEDDLPDWYMAIWGILIVVIFLTPVVARVVLPFWYEVTKWSWLAPR